jgi:hypothetical protein
MKPTKLFFIQESASCLSFSIQLLLTGQGVDGPSLRAVAAGLAAYPEVVRCSLWRTNVGDEVRGREAVGRCDRLGCGS